MRIVRVICDRCGFEQQEDDLSPDDWDRRFSGDVCEGCANRYADLATPNGASS